MSGCLDPNCAHRVVPFLDVSSFLDAQFAVANFMSRGRPNVPWFRRTLQPLPERLTSQDRQALDEWSTRGFTELERLVWQNHGLGRFDAARAEQCRLYGITPPMLYVEVDGQRIGSRLRGGESAASVRARLDTAAAG